MEREFSTRRFRLPAPETVLQHIALRITDLVKREPPSLEPKRAFILTDMPPQSPPAPDPKSVQVNVTTGTGVDIAWVDGHQSHYDFQYLRDACPCALCNEERDKEGRQPGERPKANTGELPMFHAAARPSE